MTYIQVCNHQLTTFRYVTTFCTLLPFLESMLSHFINACFHMLFLPPHPPPHNQMVMKCADLGHLSSAVPVHKKWVSRLEEEVR